MGLPSLKCAHMSAQSCVKMLEQEVVDPASGECGQCLHAGSGGVSYLRGAGMNRGRPPWRTLFGCGCRYPCGQNRPAVGVVRKPLSPVIGHRIGGLSTMHGTRLCAKLRRYSWRSRLTATSGGFQWREAHKLWFSGVKGCRSGCGKQVSRGALSVLPPSGYPGDRQQGRGRRRCHPPPQVLPRVRA